MCGCLLAAWNNLQGLSLVPGQLKPPHMMNSASWEVMPSRDWLEVPLGHRATVGHELLEVPGPQQDVRVSVPCTNMSPLLSSDRPDLWKSPFAVGFLLGSVVFAPHSGILRILDKCRPDVLFMGDLGTAQHRSE